METYLYRIPKNKTFEIDGKTFEVCYCVVEGRNGFYVHKCAPNINTGSYKTVAYNQKGDKIIYVE